ncbi:isochorismatase family protein [Bordetella sp. N]|uniref:isochorismatase family protein n=1 Tax=Bordetella sp. N TaxID=1746199 RepID=UPI00070F9AC7|nr:isochorismatase family protein [Bordetella sp. N]ALM83621.1 hydrolase [Bordetella sp. N]
MPLTALDPKTALVAIDLQKGIVAMPTTPPSADVVKAAAQLAKAFRKQGLPVVWVNVAGGAPGRTDTPRPTGERPADWAELVTDLGVEPSDHRVTKQQLGGFAGTTLDQYLRRKGVTQIVLVGISTSIGVESTARAAYDIGYNVTLVTDAMADRDPDMHRHSIEKVFPRLGERTTVAELTEALGKR